MTSNELAEQHSGHLPLGPISNTRLPGRIDIKPSTLIPANG